MAYDIETRRKAVEAINRGAKLIDVARTIGCDKDQITKWSREPDKWLVDKSHDILKELFGNEKIDTNNNVVEYKDSIVLAIPDLHCPFEHQDALEFLRAVRAKHQPTTIVCLGDEIDAHAFSRFPKDPDGLTSGKEMAKAREHLLPFYLEFPDVLVCESNHTVRPWKIAFEHGLPASFLPSYATFLNAPDGWQWKSRHIIDDVLYIHGDAGRSGQYAHIHYVKAFKKSVVIGHIHSYAGIGYEGNLFGVNSGCLIDTDAYCFKYAKNMAISVNLGCSIIKNGRQAEFIPMLTDENNRWVGHL